MDKFTKAELLSQGKKDEVKMRQAQEKETRINIKSYIKQQEKELEKLEVKLEKVEKKLNKKFRYMLERDLENKFIEKGIDEKDRNKEKFQILKDLIDEFREKIWYMDGKEKQEEKLMLKKQTERYQIELTHYETGLEMELAMNGLSKTSKLDLIKETWEFVNAIIDGMDDFNKEQLIQEFQKAKKIKRKNAEEDLIQAKDKIKQFLEKAVFEKKISMPEQLFEKLGNVVDKIAGITTDDKNSIKDHIKNNIDKRVLSMKDQIELLEQMEQDLKSIDKEIDPFQKQLLNEAIKLDINESQINEKKIDILKSMTDELEANFHNVNLSDDRKKSQKDVLKEIAQIHQELGKHDVENALQNEFELIEKETEKKLESKKDDPGFKQTLGNEILEEHEEKKENLMKKKKAEVKALKERLKEFRYVVKPKVEISEPKHPYDFLKNVEFSVAVKPGGENFYNIQEDFFEQYVNYNEKPQLFAKPNEEDSALFGEKIKSIGAEGKNCVILKNFVKKAIYNGSKDYTTEVLRARLGAQALSSVLNGKRFSTDLAYAVLASLAGAGSIAFVLDTFVWPALLLVLHITQPHSFLFMIVSCILNSLTALFGETFDSGVIKKFLDTLKGGSFLPASWKEAIALLKDSAIAGGVAAVGSIPLNLIVMFNSWYLMPVAAIANQIATSTAGAMIPMEISKMQRFTKAAFLLKTQSGFYAKPNKEQLENIKFKLEKKNRNKLNQFFKLVLGRAYKEATEEEVYKEFVRLKVKLAMTLGKTSSFATSSMGIGSFLGFITWLPVFSLAKIGFVNEAWQRIISIMTNTPTEIYSFTLGTLTANIMRNKTFSSWWASDAVKSERMIELIFEKAINQMNTKGEELEEITDEEIYKIYITKLSAYVYGEGVVKVMNFVIGGILKGVSKLKRALGFQVPSDLLEGVDVTKIMSPDSANEILEDDIDAEDNQEDNNKKTKIGILKDISDYVSTS